MGIKYGSMEEVLAILPENHRVVVRRLGDGIVLHGDSVPQDYSADEKLRKLLAGAKFFDKEAAIIGPPNKP